MTTVTMPEPTIDPWNKPFWDACGQGRLLMQRCRTTGRTWYPPAPVSPFDLDGGWDWVECSGRGTILSWVVFHQKYFAGFADRLPYNCALIELEEGARLISNVDAPNDQVGIGRAVTVKFEPRGAFKVPVFSMVG